MRRHPSPHWKRLILCGVLAASGAAGATDVLVRGRITQLYADKHGDFVRIALDKPMAAESGCGSSSHYYVEFPSSARQEPVMGILLLALQLRQPIELRVSGCTASLYWGKTHPAAADVSLGAAMP
jgi:hypothetical protein